MTVSTIMNYMIGGYIFKSYEELVKRTLDKYLDKLNKDKFHDRGLEWYVTPNHFWMELRVLSGRDNRRASHPANDFMSPQSSVIDEVVDFNDGKENNKRPVPMFEEKKEEAAIEYQKLDTKNKKEMSKKSTNALKSPPDTKNESNDENESSRNQRKEEPLELEDLEGIEDLEDQNAFQSSTPKDGLRRRKPKNTRTNSDNETVRLPGNLFSKGTDNEELQPEGKIEQVELEKKVFST